MPVTYHSTRLENGLQLGIAEMPHMESAAVGFWVAAGTRHEPEGKTGLAHFIEHLLFKGTSIRSASEIVREIEGLGASVDAFTTEDHTCYYCRGPADTLETMVEVLSDMFMAPLFSPHDIENEREVIEEEISMYHDQPAQHLEDLLSQAAWGSHPLGRPITGTEETLADIGRDDITAFHHRAYAGAQTTISVAGNVSAATVEKLIRSRLDALNPGDRLSEEPYRWSPNSSGNGASTTTPEPVFSIRDTEQVHLAIGFHGGGRHDESRYALKMLDVILGENMSSLLFQRLREEEGLCYSVQSDIMAFEDTGLIHVYVALDPENLERTLELIAAIFSELRSRPVPAAHLEEARRYILGQSRVGLESTGNQMNWCGESLLSYGRIVDPDESREKIRRVTAESIQQLCQELLVPGRAALAAVGPDGIQAPITGFPARLA